MMSDDGLRERLRLVAITNRSLCPGNLPGATRELIEGGVTAVMLREKDITSRELYEMAVSLRRICHELGALFIVNNSLEVALASGADGVHVGMQSIPAEMARKLAPPPFIIGYSAHEPRDLDNAREWGMDYCTISPIFYPTSKEISFPPIGVEGLQRSVQSTTLPLVALGGITAGNAVDCFQAGAAGVAAIGTLYGAPDRREAAAAMSAAMRA